jgi:glyoxylase-like metal-dependent hydrolase (beta-lactamase superfamily II)
VFNLPYLNQRRGRFYNDPSPVVLVFAERSLASGGMSAVAAVAPGITRIVVATPWPVGPVNVYLLDDDPLTLIDTPQRSDASLAELEAGLAELGRHVQDLERIVVTHQHIDHCGLARALVDRSHAELCALGPMADWLERYPASSEDEDAFATTMLRRHGLSSAAEHGAHRGGRRWGEPVEVTRRLQEDDLLTFAGRRLRVLHRPGHSPYDTVLHDEDAGLLFGGDHVLNWPSTPVMAPPVNGDARNGRPRAFRAYLSSLRATQALALDTILPGHGDPVEDHRATIAERLARYARVTERTAAVVGPEPRTAAAIAAELKGPLSDRVAFFVLCEVLGHLDELIDAGAVSEHVDREGVSRFAAA